LGIDIKGKTIESIALKVADALLEDLSRAVPDKHKTLNGFATPERIKVWKDLDILPVGLITKYLKPFIEQPQEPMETRGTLCISSCAAVLLLFGTRALGFSIALDSLFGLLERDTVKTNIEALKEGGVNIAVRGHSSLLVSEIIKQGRSEEFVCLARENGAEGIKFYGICCSGLSAMYRYGGVIPLSNAIGAELILGTGALDLWVADVQDVFPMIVDVAKCFKTTVVTTSDSARLPGAEHYGYDHTHSNLNETKNLAKKIIRRAIESFAARRDIPVFIPNYEVNAEIGFSLEYAVSHFGSINAISDAFNEGRITGVVNLVGYSNTRIIYEKSVVDVAAKLIENNILVLTNGCASFPLMKLGFCNQSGFERTGRKLRGFLEPALSPVWHMGECIDNARASALFRALSDALGKEIKKMPFALTSQEWSNEIGMGAALAVRCGLFNWNKLLFFKFHCFII